MYSLHFWFYWLNERNGVNANTLNKYYDKQGNEINDEQPLKDIANVKVVISYNEYKTEGDPIKPKCHVVRK
jgi:hypothetical protein